MVLFMSRPWKHPKTGVYWLRKRVPDVLRPTLGKQEHRESLHTKDPQEAKRLHASKLAVLEAQWVTLRAQSNPETPKHVTLTELDAHARAAWVYDFWLNLHRENPSEQKKWHTNLYDRLWLPMSCSPANGTPVGNAHEAVNIFEGFEQSLQIHGMRDLCRSYADSVLDAHNLALDEQSFTRLERAVGAALQRASRTLQQWAAGDFIDRSPKPGPAGEVKRGISFEFLLRGWEAERKPLPKTIYEYGRIIRDFRAFLGQVEVSEVQTADVVRWKSHLIECGLHPKTIKDGKLSPVRAIMQWGVDFH